MDSETFDLSDLTSGISYPKDEVVITIDEDAAYQLTRIEKEIQANPEDESLEEKRQALVKRAADSRYVFRLQGHPRSSLLAAFEAVHERFPVEFGSFGKIKPNPERVEAEADIVWATHIIEIEDPQGRKAYVNSEEEARELRRGIPSFASEAVMNAINDLTENVTKGFENLAMETDFLSKR